MITGEPVIQGAYSCTPPEILSQCIETFGRLPPHLLDQGTNANDFLDIYGTSNRIGLIVGSVPGTPYNNCIQKRLYEAYPTIDDATVHVLTDFLSSVMPMDPRLRPSPDQLLKHRWFASRYRPENSWCLAPTPKELSDPDYPTDSDLDFTGSTTFTLCVCGSQGESTAVFS